MKAPLNILYVEDNEVDVVLTQSWLEADDIICELRNVDTREAFIAQLEARRPDVIFSDFTLPTYSGMEALADAQRLARGVPFIFLSGTIGEEVAIESLRNGATDYVLKGNLTRLVPVLRRALAEAEEQQRRRQAEQRIRQSEARFNAFMKNLPGVAFMKDKDRRYVYINSLCSAYLAHDAIECLGMRDEEILDPAIAESRRASDEHVLTHGDILQKTEEVTIDGRPRKWLITKFPIADKYGSTTWLGGVGIEITEPHTDRE